MFNVVLVHPEIPHNTGAAGRLVLAAGARLHLVKPLGFDIDEKTVKRAGLDYWKDVDLVIWESWEEFEASVSDVSRMFLLTTKTEKAYWDADLKEGDYLLFGRETRGLAEPIIEKYQDTALTIPMVSGGTRSLNLATAVGIVLFEGMRQMRLEE
ncbi:tRNA (cytidine(34)-2'-O)-methyltransferase [Rubritalea marina]|uniref:tRNA (cytidine(34)-2'-O)-methyltransferase n=1 Tax=Rubritalea marina TaxID=361055 RepID=UPI00035E3AC7|nr:tRNA (cytidine(34)-2'-O)-methyltransferase [Rubritalea marina]